MANPAGYMNTYSPQPADGAHPGFIPNGQPPQFNRPPVFPQKVAPPRPAMIGQQPSFSSHQVASNGQHSHPSSLSSHSSRNPSPVPPRPNDEGLSASTPNLAGQLPPQHRHQMEPPPHPGQTNSAPGQHRQNYAASQPNLGPIRHQMPPPPNTPSHVQLQSLSSLTNSPLNSPLPAAGSQPGAIRPQFPSNVPNSQFGADRQFPPSITQMPSNSPQPAPSYQSGLIRPQMPPNMSQIPLNPPPPQVGPSRQVVPNPQTSFNSQQQMPPAAQFNSAAPSPNQMPPPSRMVPPGQGYGSNPNIPPKSVLNLNNGARYPETGYAAPIGTSSAMTPPRPSMAQNRYPPQQTPAGVIPPQFDASSSPVVSRAAYPGVAPPIPRTNALGTLPPPPPGQGPPPHMPPLPPVTSQSLPGTPQNRHAAPYQSLPAAATPPIQPAPAGYSQQPAPVFAPPPAHNEGLGSHLAKRYPTQSQPYTNQIQPNVDTSVMNQQMASMSVAQHGFQKLWGGTSYDLLQQRNILPPEKVETPKVKLHQEFLDSVNCSPEIFRCTMTKIPETSALLQKSRLPLGILIHPFKDLNECRLEDQGQHSSIDDECASDFNPSLKHLAVIQCSSIVRCRACRTYINPFVYFVDHKRWKCNLCFRVNELPEEFQFDPVSKTYGDPTRRPEIKSATIEFIAPSEYMLRPPQPAVYLFLLDVSRLGVECGYLSLFCETLMDELDRLPGDGRTQVGFIAYDSAIHFYSLAEGLGQPQEMTVLDVDDIFLPVPDSLIVNLNESKELIRDLLTQLPIQFQDSNDTHSALGPALQAAYKLMVRGHEGQPQPDLHDFERCSSRVPYYKRKAPTGGRVTVFQCCLPNFGPGALTAREDPTLRAGKEAPHLNPATDFYKRLALDCSGQQIAVDLFIVNSQYCDLATLSGISRFSGGCIHHIPLFKATNPHQADKLQQSFRRYLSRKLGMEAVMRIRCSRGLSIHTFHGNFFVRSTDLLSLPNVNPDAGFGMQVSVEENLSDLQNVCFQAALLYTSTKGERRIRVHTMCLPVCANLSDVIHSADQQCIVGLLAKMGVDRAHQSSLSDARDAFINVAIDVLSAYRVAQASTGTSALLVPHNLRLLPLYILALLKYVAFRTGQSTRLDDRLFAMCQMKTLPLANLMQEIYPDLYPIHTLGEQSEIDVEGTIVPQPPRLQLTSEKLETSGAYLLDAGDHMIIFVGRNVNSTFCQAALGVQSFAHVSEDILDLPEVDTPESDRLRRFVNHLQTEKAYPATIQLIRDDSQMRVKFYERLIEDRTESALSYYEFLQHLKTNVK